MRLKQSSFWSQALILAVVIGLTTAATSSGGSPAPEASDVRLGAPMPDVFYPTQDGSNAWVSATVLNRPAVARVELPNVRMAERIKEVVESTRSEGCRTAGEVVRVETVRPDLPTALRNVPHVFIGRVTGRAPGFFFGIPSTLFRVETEEAFKGPTAVGIEQYFSLPVADFTVGGVRVCRTNSGYPTMPEVGDRVLVLSDRTNNSHGYLRIAGTSGLVVLPSVGGISLPRNYQTDREGWKGDQLAFIEWVRDLTEVGR